MDVQNVSNLEIPEGEVRTIHDKDSRLLWGRVHYDTKYKGDTFQHTYSGKNLLGLPNGTETSKGVNWVRLNNSATGTGTASGNYSRLSESYTNFASPLPAGTYTFSIGSAISKRLELLLVDSSNTNHFNYINIGDTSVTITTNYQAVKFRIAIANLTADESINVAISNLQLESGTTATSFEPYVGGTASPNPDYPQDIDVVTGEQNVWVHGKNVASPNSIMVYKNNADIVITPLSTGIQISHPYNGQNKQAIFSTGINLTPYKGKVIRMKSTFDVSGAYRLARMDSDGNNRVLENYTTTSGTVISLTVPNDLGVSEYLGFQLLLNSTSALVCNFTDLIITIDNADMTYEPYQFQSYTVDLGSTELCKIGDYQDYIYKSGDDWYVHKDCGKNIVDTSTITNYTSYTNIDYALVPKPTDYIDYDTFQYTTLYFTHAICYQAPSSAGISGYDNASNIGKGYLGATKQKAYVGFEKGTSLSDIKTTMTGATYYYPLATPTDTQITDNTLISQLNAIHEWLVRYGYYGTVSTSSPNILPMIIDRTNFEL